MWIEGLDVLGWFQDVWPAVCACAVCLWLTPRVVPARASRRDCAPCVIRVVQLLAILTSDQCLEHICLVVSQGFGPGGAVRVMCGGHD